MWEGGDWRWIWSEKVKVNLVGHEVLLESESKYVWYDFEKVKVEHCGYECEYGEC